MLTKDLILNKQITKNIYNNSNSKINGEYDLFVRIKDNINIIFDIGCKTNSDFLIFNGICHYFDPREDFINEISLIKNNNKKSYFNKFGLGEANTTLYYYPKYQSFYNRTTSCKINDDKNKILLNIKKAKDYIIEQNIEYIDFVKIDTEGFELSVLKGFENYLKNVKIIQFEYGGTYLDNSIKLVEVKNYLETFGFNDFSYLVKNGSIPITNFNDHYQYCNIVCINKNFIY